jgi:hypothetical protein
MMKTTIKMSVVRQQTKSKQGKVTPGYCSILNTSTECCERASETNMDEAQIGVH